jgi:uncharacterized protein (DUF1810 family)
MAEEEDRKQISLQMLREATAYLEFNVLPGEPYRTECQICWAVVDPSSHVLHMDWHDKVHASLVELRDLLTDA